jgi:hypothetical protein
MKSVSLKRDAWGLKQVSLIRKVVMVVGVRGQTVIVALALARLLIRITLMVLDRVLRLWGQMVVVLNSQVLI